MAFEYFEAESHVSTYNKFRPSPPKSLVEEIIQFTAKKLPEPLEVAVDVGCGSGQSTEVLAPFFKRVIGIDSSESIIKEARKKCHCLNVYYRKSPGEKMDLNNEVADVITVGQALHWLDIPKFYLEADRVLKKNGVFAVYGYNLPTLVHEENLEISTLIEKYYKNILADYTLPQSQKVYLDNYRGKEFNDVFFVENEKMERFGNFDLETDGTINDVRGYITSWSAFQNYKKQMGEEESKKLLKQFESDLKLLLSKNNCEKIKINFKYFLLMGRKK